MDEMLRVLDEAERVVVTHDLNPSKADDYRRQIFRWWYFNCALAKTADARGLIHKREAR